MNCVIMRIGEYNRRQARLLPYIFLYSDPSNEFALHKMRRNNSRMKNAESSKKKVNGVFLHLFFMQL